jgi:hypothetical protein
MQRAGKDAAIRDLGPIAVATGEAFGFDGLARAASCGKGAADDATGHFRQRLDVLIDFGLLLRRAHDVLLIAVE